jgi:two-component system sensor histidine kinase YesM
MEELYLEVTVENNGKSPDLSEMNRLLDEGTGIRKHGLANVNRRLRLRFGEESGLRFEIPDDGGLIVRFRIPA